MSGSQDVGETDPAGCACPRGRRESLSGGRALAFGRTMRDLGWGPSLEAIPGSRKEASMTAARWGSGGHLRVGVIGTGFGKAHVRAFTAHPRATVSAVCSTDAS